MDKKNKSEEQWRESLTPEQYHVLREKGTERAFTGKYWDSKEEGTYCCAACGNPLFDSTTKYDSGTGWPSFYQTLSTQSTMTQEDHHLGLSRTEVLCAQCQSHLGHVFPDGPAPTKLRYCMNSEALSLKKR